MNQISRKILVEGIILSYDAMVGIALIRHQRFRDLDSLAEAYAKSTKDLGFWFVKFRWKSVREQSKDGISLLRATATPRSHSARTSKKGQKRRSSPRKLMIRDVIVGRTIECYVMKTPKWEAFDVSILLDGETFNVTARRRSTELPPFEPQEESSLAELRRERVDLSRPNNLRNPWGGMSN